MGLGLCISAVWTGMARTQKAIRERFVPLSVDRRMASQAAVNRIQPNPARTIQTTRTSGCHNIFGKSGPIPRWIFRTFTTVRHSVIYEI